ncbi:RNA polymerase II C-terminal domain phosphatase-like protein 4 [Tanacetum coccineum]
MFRHGIRPSFRFTEFSKRYLPERGCQSQIDLLNVLTWYTSVDFLLKLPHKTPSKVTNTDAVNISIEDTEILGTVHSQILKGCKIVYSRIFPIDFTAENHKFRKIAERLGATCATEIDTSVTHRQPEDQFPVNKIQAFSFLLFSLGMTSFKLKLKQQSPSNGVSGQPRAQTPILYPGPVRSFRILEVGILQKLKSCQVAFFDS